LLLCSSYLPLGVPNELYINTAIKHFSGRRALSHQAIFWRRCRGVKDIFTRGVPHNQSLYFVIFVLLSFFLLCLLVSLSKTQKNSFTSLLSLLKTQKNDYS